MTTDIEIRKHDVMRRVEMDTAYAGAKADDPAMAYRRVAAGDSDRELLDGFWTAATTRADVCLGKWLLCRHDGCCNGDYNVTLRIPHGFNMARMPALCHTLHDMIVAHIVADWMAVAAPNMEGHYRVVAENMVWQMRRIMDSGRKRRMEVV